MRGRLFLRYWIVVSGLITGILLLGGGSEIFFAYRENIKRIEAVQRAEVRSVAGRIGQALGDVERSVKETASLPWHEKLLGMQDAKQEFHRLLKVVSPIYEVRGLGVDGQSLLVSRIRPDEIAPGAVNAQSATAPTKPGYGPIRYRNGSEPFTTLAIELPGPNNLFKSIEADINLKFVSDVIREASPGSGRKVYVVDASDNLVAHTDPTLPLRRLSFTALGHVQSLRAAGSADTLESQISKDFAGNDVVASGMPIGTSRWAAFVEEPREHALADAMSTVRRTVLMVLAGLVAAVLASYLLARRLSQPILRLQDGADRVARGDLTARIEVKTGDEVESLADKFNQMAAQLQDYTTGLERKVSEKTAALEAADTRKSELLAQVDKQRTAAEQALQLAQEAMRARALFLAAASHDLRQPLYAISILADTLALDPHGAQAPVVIEKQIQAIGMLRTLFDNLLDLSRFDAGEVRATLRVISLRDLLEPLASEHAVLCDAKKLDFSSELPEVWVRTDPELVKRLAGNLLANAVRYTEAGSVKLGARVEGERVIVVVEDSGIGIAAADQARVFDEFVQLSNPGRARDKGVGLGLSIVRKVAELLDAHLSLKSLPGQGTTVTFELALVAKPEVEVEAKPWSFAKGDLEGIRLWVVEDDSDVRSALALQFSTLGADHAFASNHAELLELREELGEWPDAVMLDDMLGPGEFGLEIAQSLLEHLDRERIVIVTGGADPERARLLAASGFRVFRKPLVSSELASWLLRVSTLERTP